jgi:hypothetical protein
VHRESEHQHEWSCFHSFFIHAFIHQWLYSPSLGPGHFFGFVILHIVSITPWTRDQPVARPLPTHRTTHRMKPHKHICLEWDSNPRTSVLAGEDGSRLRLRGHCYRHCSLLHVTKTDQTMLNLIHIGRWFPGRLGNLFQDLMFTLLPTNNCMEWSVQGTQDNYCREKQVCLDYCWLI